jgi:hypothetical protein
MAFDDGICELRERRLKSMREAPLDPKLKYPWQQPLLDAFMEFHPEHIRDKLTTAEIAISRRLFEKPTDPHEVRALRDALLALRTLARESKPPLPTN